jgi:hypothetical protein
VDIIADTVGCHRRAGGGCCATSSCRALPPRGDCPRAARSESACAHAKKPASDCPSGKVGLQFRMPARKTQETARKNEPGRPRPRLCFAASPLAPTVGSRQTLVRIAATVCPTTAAVLSPTTIDRPAGPPAARSGKPA